MDAKLRARRRDRMTKLAGKHAQQATAADKEAREELHQEEAKAAEAIERELMDGAEGGTGKGSSLLGGGEDDGGAALRVAAAVRAGGDDLDEADRMRLEEQERRALDDAHRAADLDQERLDAEHEAERQALDMAMEAEEGAEVERKAKEAEERKQDLLEKKRKEIQARVEAAGASTEEEVARMRAQYESEVAALDHTLEVQQAEH